MGVGDSWGTKEQLLHPRDSHGRFRNTWKMAANVVEKLLATLASFNPKTFTSDEEAANYVQSQARSNRFLTNRGAAIDRFLKGYSTVNADLRAGRPNKDATEIDKGFNPLKEDLILSRVVGPEAFGLNPQNTGQVEELTGKLVSDKGYSSTNVGTPMAHQPGAITMSIAAPAGTRALVPSTSRPTREIILPRDQPYRITKVDPDGQGGFYVYAVVAGDSQSEKPVDIGKAIPGKDVEVAPETAGPGAGTQTVPGGTAGVVPAGPGVGKRQGRPPGPGPGARNEGHVGVVGPGQTQAGIPPETGQAPEAPEVPEIPQVPETGPDTRSTFRAAFEKSDLKVPSVGTRRKEFNDAFLGVSSGKKTPQEAVRDLDDRIAVHKATIASDKEDGTDSGPLPEDVKRLEALSDLIKEHYNFTGRKTRKTAPETVTPAEKKAPGKAPAAKKAVKAAVPEKKAPEKRTGNIARDLQALEKEAATAKKTAVKKAVPEKKAPIRNEPRGRINKIVAEHVDRRRAERQDRGAVTPEDQDRRTEAFKRAAQAVADGATGDELDALAAKEMDDKSLHPEDAGYVGSRIMALADSVREGKQSVAKSRARRAVLDSGRRDQDKELLDFLDGLGKKPVVKKAAVAKKTTPRRKGLPPGELERKAREMMEGKKTSSAGGEAPGDVDKMTIPQLREEANRRGVKIPSSARRKADIVDFLHGRKTAEGSETKVPEVKASETKAPEVKTPETGKPLWGTIKTHGFKPGDIVMFHGFDRRKPNTEGRRVRLESSSGGYRLVDPETGKTVNGFGSAHRQWLSRIGKPGAAEKKGPAEKGLESMKIAELRQKAKDEGIRVPGDRKTKKDIVDFLADALAAKDRGEEIPEQKTPAQIRAEKVAAAKKAAADEKALRDFRASENKRQQKEAFDKRRQEQKEAREKAVAEKKAAAEKAAEERKAAREKAAADRKAQQERVAAEKKAAREKEKEQVAEEKRLGKTDDYSSLTGPNWDVRNLRMLADVEGIKVPSSLVTREEIRQHVVAERLKKRAEEYKRGKTVRRMLSDAKDEGISIPYTVHVAGFGDPDKIAQYITSARQSLADQGIDPKKYRPQGRLRQPLEARGGGGTFTQEDWDSVLPRNTDPNHPVRIEGFRTPGGYEMQHGVAVRREGITYVAETTTEDADNPYHMSRIAKELEDFHKQFPDRGKYQHTYFWIRGRNPADEFWAKKYNTPGFKSAATGGNGQVTLWARDQSLSDGSPVDSASTLSHEFGHNVDRHHAHSESPDWHAAGRSDTRHLAGLEAESRLTARPVSNSHPLSLKEDLARAYPNGITDYGMASDHEDFAETMMLYLLDIPIARNGRGDSLFFEDLFPARTRYMDKLFPRRAAERKKLRAKR